MSKYATGTLIRRIERRADAAREAREILAIGMNLPRPAPAGRSSWHRKMKTAAFSDRLTLTFRACVIEAKALVPTTRELFEAAGV